MDNWYPAPKKGQEPGRRRRRRRAGWTVPRVYVPPIHGLSSSSRTINGERFIPNRSATNYDVARFLIEDSQKDNPPSMTASKELYRKLLGDILLPNRERILAFKNKSKTPSNNAFQDTFGDVSYPLPKVVKKQRSIPQAEDRILDAPDLIDDFYLNLLDWGSSNILSIALGNTVYLWDASHGSHAELVSFNEDMGPVTSVTWDSDGRHVAIGLNSSVVQIWDATSFCLLRTLRGAHRSRVGSLAWNKSILATGGMDGLVVSNDVRVQSHVISVYRGHQQEVCGLKWSGFGQKLASGGNDNLVHIWDLSMSSSNPANHPSNRNQWLHRFEDHTAAVKALAWCPFQQNLLATGGGDGDNCIKFWSTQTGACLNSVDTGSQVCALLWDKKEDLLSSHGFPQNQLAVWKYPSMLRCAALTGHSSRVLFMVQSPDGCMVASAAGGRDETLRFWKFGDPEPPEPPTNKTTSTGLFFRFDQLR